MAVCHEDFAVRSKRHVAGTVEEIRPFAGHALRAQRQEHLAISRKLQDLLATAVRASARP